MFSLDKPTSQTSVGWGGASSRAVDGRLNGLWPQGTCTHTQKSGTQSWSVNLEDQFVVSSVVIHNRRDCCQERLNGAKVSYTIVFTILKVIAVGTTLSTLFWAALIVSGPNYGRWRLQRPNKGVKIAEFLIT